MGAKRLDTTRDERCEVTGEVTGVADPSWGIAVLGRTITHLGVTVPTTSSAASRSRLRSVVGATLLREEGVHTMANGPSLQDRCLGLPSVRDLAWVAAHFGHR